MIHKLKIGFIEDKLASDLGASHGENESCDFAAVEAYKKEFPKIVAGYSTDQIYNADETGLIYFSLPTKTYVTPEEDKI